MKIRKMMIVLAVLAIFLSGAPPPLQRVAQQAHPTGIRKLVGMFAYAQSQNEPACEKTWDEMSVASGTSPPVCRFVDPLIRPLSVNVSTGQITTIGMYRIKQKVHRDLPPTEFFAYGTSQETASFPGPTLEATRGITTQIQWENHLTGDHLFEEDETLEMDESSEEEIPLVPHLHGSEVESWSDGHPEAWWTANGTTGPTFNSSLYTYHNRQNPCILWYHDHVLGMTRLNVYAGLVGMYILRDPSGPERLLTPSFPSGEYEWPLIFSDKTLTANGSAYFADKGVTRAHPVWVPEFFGDLVLVNGKAYPYLNVKPRKYRFRMLNAGNARFLNVLFNVTSLPEGSHNVDSRPVTVAVIGSDGGYLESPFYTKRRLLMGPAERLDVIVNFSKYPPGTEIILTNSASTPFPHGDEVSPSAMEIIKFVVGDLTPEELRMDRLPRIPRFLNAIPDLAARRVSVFRQLTMQEFADDESGEPLYSVVGGCHFKDPVTEMPRMGSVELWQIINLTEDTHPLHIHLAPFRIVSRQPFDKDTWISGNCTVPAQQGFTGTPNLYNPTLPNCRTGAPYFPKRYEGGWKDTARANPGEILLLAIQFSPQNGGEYPFDPTKGPGYVWHCHILAHEDNEMMRPFKMLPPNEACS